MEGQANTKRQEYPVVASEVYGLEVIAPKSPPPEPFMGRWFRSMVQGATAIFILLIVEIFLELLFNSLPSIRQFGLRFLWTTEWNPVTEQFGALPFIFGTVVSSLIALALAAWVGISERRIFS